MWEYGAPPVWGWPELNDSAWPGSLVTVWSWNAMVKCHVTVSPGTTRSSRGV